MKKIAKVVSLFLILALVVSCFAGCAEKKATLIGTWTLTTSSSEWFLAGDMMKLNEDGTVMYESQAAKKTFEGQYEVTDSGKVKLQIAGQIYMCDITMEKGSLTGTFDGVTLVFRH